MNFRILTASAILLLAAPALGDTSMTILVNGQTLSKVEMGQVLDVEVVQKRISGLNQVGALMVANNSGGVIHPEADEEDMKMFANVLGIHLEHSTINGGVPFVESGLLVNNNSVVVGSLTTGPEIMMLTRAFLN